MNDVTINPATSIAKLFSANVLNELARKGQSEVIAHLVSQLELPIKKSSDVRVEDIYDAAYNVLKKPKNRNEYVYKSALTQKVLLGVHSLKTASMLTEFRVGRCKADLVLLNGTGTVYEIKSERDSLSRLTEQVSAYREVFASVNVIAGENHINTIFELIPEDVGVIKLSTRQNLSIVRRAINRPERTNSAAIFDSIRINEAKMILTRCGVAVPDLPNTQLYFPLKALFIKLPAEVAHAEMVRTLKQTRDLSPLADFVRQLPTSLRAAGLTMHFKKPYQQRLIQAMHASYGEAMGWAL